MNIDYLFWFGEGFLTGIMACAFAALWHTKKILADLNEQRKLNDEIGRLLAEAQERYDKAGEMISELEKLYPKAES